MRAPRFFSILYVFLLLGGPAAIAVSAQSYTVNVEPASLQLAVGDSATLSVEILDEAGNMVDDIRTIVFSRDRKSVAVDRRTGTIIALASGTHTVLAGGIVVQDGQREFVTTEVTVTVPYPPITGLAFRGAPQTMYAGTRLPVRFDVVDEAGHARHNVAVTISSSNPDVVSLDPFKYITAHRTGRATLHAEIEDVRAEHTIEVIDNPVVRVEFVETPMEARTGDVLNFAAVALDAQGAPIADAPIEYAVQAVTDDRLGPAASGQIDPSGRFVAEQPGLYTVFASSGPATAHHAVRITPRNVTREIELVGKGVVSDVHTSDLWVWEGVDGRDYAVTGTWGANGEAYFWDVSEPTHPVIIDTVTVDARTVNDVKVSADGRVCVISREGASNRRNGLVILDCTNPYEVTILAEYDDHLTGGVHNLFIYENHIFALSAGQRFDIINIDDPAKPHRVGSFELDTPGHAIHDVWVEDGIAYSSNWDDGVVMIDVGNGIAGGSPSNPVKITSYAYPSGWNHAAFPYHSKETGKRYIIAGDEAFPDGNPAGWIHFIDVTDPNNPVEVARYEVPEAGTHNLWVQGDTLYVAYYQGGLRVVDISGDLMGDLYKQGREIARYRAADPNGKIPNSPMAWGPQPFKGNIFFSDMNSGLWIVRLKQDEREKKPDI